jgi:hypothetical protein
MFCKKIIIGLFLSAVHFVSATSMLPTTMLQPGHRPVHPRICNNCNDITTSASIIMRSFYGDHRFYHLQSQFGEAVRRQRCFCAQRHVLVNSIRQELVRLWPQASQQTIQELRDIGELHYDAELNATR